MTTININIYDIMILIMSNALAMSFQDTHSVTGNSFSLITECTTFFASRYDIYLTAKRESLYYTVMVVWPTILFGVLNPLVFLLPVESGERIGLSMTIMLSYAIFLTLVSA
jgi:hypothetical protein